MALCVFRGYHAANSMVSMELAEDLAVQPSKSMELLWLGEELVEAPFLCPAPSFNHQAPLAPTTCTSEKLDRALTELADQA